MLTSNFTKKILLLLFLLLLSLNTHAASYLDEISDQTKFPTLTVLNSKEEPVVLKFNHDSEKKGYVINFWATWCVPCKKELPDLSLLKSKISNFKIDVLTISIDKKEIKDQLNFLSQNGAQNIEHLFDKEMRIFKAMNLRGVPTTVIVDNKGYVISKHEGLLKWSEEKVINKIKSLLY